ncbi:MAG: LysR substrate-binding domain-containing protein [Deltaproteobacteria bacterium]
MTDELNLKQLRAFYVAATCGSITLAADMLYITQPAVSMQIKALETQYGVRLFVRGKKKLELTEAGKRLYQVARKIFALVGEAEELQSHAKAFATDVLKIGSTKTLVRYVLAPYISRFQESFPKVQIQIDEGSSSEMVQSVLSNQNDLAMVGRMPYDERLDVIPFAQHELVLLAAPGHRFCQQDEVSIEDLKGENLVLREKGSGTRRVVEKIFEGTEIVSSAFIESRNVDFIKELVRIENGITILARMGVDDDVARGDLKIVPVKEGPFMMDGDIVINNTRPLPKAAEAFLNVFLESKGRYTLDQKPSIFRDLNPTAGKAAADTDRLPRSGLGATH